MEVKVHRKTWMVMAVFMLGMVGSCFAGQVITVDDNGPADFNNIQAAIDDSNDGDTIVVSQGMYNENIDFKGKNIMLRSDDPNNPAVVEATIIFGGGRTSVVTFSGSEDVNCVLSGFKILGGCVSGGIYGAFGGGIYGNGTRATIEHNIVTHNFVDCIMWPCSSAGGGLFDCDGTIQYNIISYNHISAGDVVEGWSAGAGLSLCDGTIQYNIITRNHAMNGDGGGLGRCNGTIRNNIISYNKIPSGGGGGLGNCNGIIENNTIFGNSALEGGGAAWYYGNPTISNCILWGNTADSNSQIYGSATVSYSNVQGGYPGDGNIDVDPLFVHISHEDFHLKSQAGRWEPSSESWIQDDVTSPCIDAGNPADPIGQEPFPNGGIINMGAYGGTTEASKSYFGEPVCETIIAGDINGDCEVNSKDFALMALHWLEER